MAVEKFTGIKLIEAAERQQDDDSWPPPPSGRQYKTDGTPEELLKELREALAAVYGHLEEAQGDHDCCYAGITESYCGIFGCTPDGCYGHEQDCPCDEGTAVRFLLEMADSYNGTHGETPPEAAPGEPPQ